MFKGNDAELDLTERIAATTDALFAYCQQQGVLITGDGRVSSATAARLLGIPEQSLRNARCSGRGPRAFSTGVGGGRISFRLSDLAVWIEERAE